MQQRRLRLGDVLDDYCPRERRITNHVVAAMIGDDVKQTRCSTCEADHEYKHGKAPAPRRRRPEAGLAGEIEGALRPRAPVNAMDVELDDDEPQEEGAQPDAATESSEIPAVAQSADQDNETGDPDGEVDADAERGPADDDGPVHRRLIRATLPRQEGQVPERKATDFTVRQPGSGRGGGGREFDGNKPGYRPGGPGGGGPGGRGGRRPMRAQGGPPGGPSRFGGPRPGSGQGQRQGGPGQGPRPPGNRPGGPGPNRGGGRPPGQGRGPGGGGGRKRGPR